MRILTMSDTHYILLCMYNEYQTLCQTIMAEWIQMTLAKETDLNENQRVLSEGKS